MIEGTSTIVKHASGKTLYITIPSKVATDSRFPFREGMKIRIRIVQGFLVIERDDV